MPSELFVEVCRIANLKPHGNADRLEVATVKGWQCVVQKGAYEVGDKIVYFPLDSVLPRDIEFKIFGDSSKVVLKKSRVKTIKLRGVISQGLTSPIGLFEMSPETPVGTDVKGLLGITKFEQAVKALPSGMQGKAMSKRRGNINFGKYTKINHIKNFPYHLDGKEIIAHEKIHGTNFRCGVVTRAPHTLWQKCIDFFQRYVLQEDHRNKEFVYGSHNVQLKKASKKQGFYPSNVYWKTVLRYDLRVVAKEISKFYCHKDVVLYGEVYGDGIQKNYSYGCIKGETKLVIFDIKIDGEYVSSDRLRQICRTFGALEIPPEMYKGPYDPGKLQEINKGNSIMVPQQGVIEGLVVRTLGDNREIFKLINPKYLLKDQSEFN